MTVRMVLSRTREAILPIVLVCLASSSSFAQSQPAAGEGQLGVPITWVGVPGADGLFYMAQRTRDGRLLLTPNEAFFPKRGLAAAGDGTVPDIDKLNGGKSYAEIRKWDRGDAAEWGIFTEKSGGLRVRVWMTSATDLARFTLRVGESEVSFNSKGTEDGPVVVAESALDLDAPGRHSVTVTCEASAGRLALHWVEISGEAADGAAVLRKRWRPAAAHTRFTSSEDPKNIRLWVMEMDAKPGDLGFYSPITTSFGYYGPTWQADGTVSAGFNFSLWSFGRGAEAPPVEQLSHLLAVGDREAEFGGFDTEGTGVKVRGWQPLIGRQGQRQVLALRVQPGEMYDTYFSYFYAADERRWRLFGVGNKFNKNRPLRSLRVGSFVEVPGRPHTQRTGAYERVMRYRGWVMDGDGEWFQLDRMSTGNVNKKTRLTHTDRGVNAEGWFYLQTGGWVFRRAPNVRFFERDADLPAPDVGYLGPEDIAALTSVPSAIASPVLERTPDGLRGTYSVRDVADDAQVTLHWGTTDTLTFAERWEHVVTLDAPQEGQNTFTVGDVPDDDQIFVRLLLSNSEGKFWTTSTVAVPAR